VEHAVELARYLGRSPKDAVLNILLSRLALSQPSVGSHSDTEFRMCSPSTGVELAFRLKMACGAKKRVPCSSAFALYSVRFYSTGHLGISAYSGGITDDLPIWSRGEDLIKAFGPSRGPIYRMPRSSSHGESSTRMLRWQAGAYSLIADVRANGQVSSIEIHIPEIS
jgi:hypothetical protein